MACSLDNSITYSTAFGDDFLVIENCCASAVDLLPSTFTEVDLVTFCNEEDEITDGSEVDFNDEANGGEGSCTMVSGFV